MALPSRKLNVCECHKKDFPPWTGELHGVTQALQSNSPGMKIFWWLVVFSCVVGGTATTVLVIIEYLNGPTATSTTIRLVTTLKLPAVTICPKIPDAFNFTLLYTDMKTFLPSISEEGARDLIRFWLGGNGLENMDDLSNYNRSYLDVLSEQYKIWSKGYSQYGFFEIMQNQYGYKCEDLFFWCQLGGKQWDCCSQLFRRQVVMRRGICYQTMPSVNQTEPDDVGRLVVSLKAPSSVTSPHYNYTQPQLLIYVTDNHEFVVDYPRYYLYPHEWNRMRFTARFIELLPHPHVCTDQMPHALLEDGYFPTLGDRTTVPSSTCRKSQAFLRCLIATCLFWRRTTTTLYNLYCLEQKSLRSVFLDARDGTTKSVCSRLKLCNLSKTMSSTSKRLLMTYSTKTCERFSQLQFRDSCRKSAVNSASSLASP
ncbi:hypothetical protein L596_003237 [Steinernema carpocapsae]|uniref:Uncharacterized protein n=1 Tax=Steinernema carpocapsae TaxID=34508 RepID=A0A4U8URY3_STECR|nr:hypothetical protein L596_003237 [Steinernema carpocapsae]